MEIHKIDDDDKKGFTRAFIGQDVEFVDPIKYWEENQIRKHAVLIRDMLNARNPLMTSLLSEDFFIKHAKVKWEKERKMIEDTQVSPNLMALLNAESKKDQIKLLKGVNLTAFQLFAFIFKAARELGYTYSSYHVEQHHKGLDEDALPTFIHVKEDGSVKTSGETRLTEGQLRNVVDQRRVVITRFIEKGDNWHCFFVTYRSLKGQESWNNNQPHFHYISDKWGISREDAVKQFKGERYPKTSVHIGLEGYREAEIGEDAE